MNIDIVSQTEFGDEQGFMDFLGMNELAHQQISDLMIGRGLSVQNIPLTENPQNNPNWLQDHYLMHQQEFTLLQISTQNLPDLSVVDFKNEDQYYDWMQNHSAVHDFVNQVLGITS